MKKISLLFAAICLLAVACKNEKSAEKPSTTTLSIEKNWSMSNHDTKNLPATGTAENLQKRMTEGWFGEKGRIGFSWSFFADGKFTEVAGQVYRLGNWSKSADGKEISIAIGNTTPEKFSVKYLDSDSMAIEVPHKNGTKIYGFKSDGANYEQPEQNPFHPKNNVWRNPPEASETDEQLRARLKNHLHHLTLILEGAISHDLKVVSFRASPSPLNQFNGGVGILKDSDLPEAWINCFFNRADALKASRLLEKAMSTSENVKLDPKDFWVKKNLAVLKSVEAWF